MRYSLDLCDGPSCPRCGCQDAIILREPANPDSWWASGAARCRHCGNAFSFQRARAQPSDPAAATAGTPAAAPQAAAETPPDPPRVFAPPEASRPQAQNDGLSPGLVFSTVAGDDVEEPPPSPTADARTICPICGGRFWAYKSRGALQYRKCKDCGHAGKTAAG